VISLDLYATALAMAGLPMPTKKPLDGVNLIPFLTGKDSGRPHQVLYFMFGSGWAVLDGDLKLVLNGDRKGPPELFDLSKDISEKKDLAPSNPEKVQQRQKFFDQWNSQNKPSLWGNSKAKDD